MNPSFCFIVRMFDFVQNNRIMRKRFRGNDFFMFSEVHVSFRLHSEFVVTDKLSDSPTLIIVLMVISRKTYDMLHVRKTNKRH